VATDTRRRMIAGAAEAIGTHGAAAMSLRDLARAAGVPLGSTYHHFPGGKSQLVEEAVAATGRQVSRLLDQAREQGVEASLRSFAEHWRVLLVRTDFATGCPVLAVATEAEPALQEVARGVFAEWQRAIASALAADGVPADRAASLGRLVIASLEGAVAVSRAERSADPLDEVVVELSALLAAVRR
jgi:TetR/AcrR family transcriptional repressor of lmrAB and yxaGH operons